jgi:hypothetical protein
MGGTSISKTEIDSNNKYVSTTPKNYDNVKQSNRVLSTQDTNKQLMNEQSGSNKDTNTNIEVNARNGKETYQEYVNRFFK